MSKNHYYKFMNKILNYYKIINITKNRTVKQ